ncbi:MAG TPA: TetR/AcrR family transcriptional regulator [Nocardioidaceae bacterium]|nr:TetR/AcrR family transcriptional regulator [Nocardioidaceae bacterium]
MPGTWGGTALEERRSARRAALLDAGVQQLGCPGARPLTVRAVCRTAGLTERYFYESFDDREAFVRAAYDHVAAQAERRLADAAGDAHGDPAAARHAVEAFVDLMLDDPTVGRTLLLAPTYEPALSNRGTARALGFVALVRARMPESADATDADLAAIGIVGALSGLLMAYLSGAVDVDREGFTRTCVDTVFALGA